MTDSRIAYFGSSTAIDGGSELCLLRMARHFSQKYPVTVFLPDEGPLYKEAVASGIDCVPLQFLRLRKHRGLDWLRWAQSVRQARRELFKICREKQVSLIHFNDFIDFPFYSVAKQLGVPSVSHLRLIVESDLSRRFYRSIVRSSGCQILAVSEAVSNRMIQGGASIRSKVLYDPGPDPDHFFPGDLSRVREPFRLIQVSKLLENKGHFRFIEVAQILEEQHPGQFSFTMVAPPSPGREDYERRVREAFAKLPAKRRIWVPGASHSELGNLLRHSDALLHLPDVEDSFPGVVLEAMACGNPCGGLSKGRNSGAIG